MMQKTKYPGLWRLPSGGYHVRTSAIDPRTGRLLTRKRNLPTATLKDAIQEVARLRGNAPSPGAPSATQSDRPLRSSRDLGSKHISHTNDVRPRQGAVHRGARPPRAA